ncbi:hypothetical protein ONE63_011340 [Megalurothrips usitatus]|uniref:SOCS box domain-containing protein n=1 Tax=Megalurothrips usitatus TaxID=439358 RepID=A0AAV7X3V3_9NEOP|nr:hypothetical protein ONE63_011340 [Megalurothrips usitatus]
MDRYEAERLLDERAEGTFLLRDSAQEEYLFSHLCRAVVSSHSTYDGINQLALPKALRSYLKEYHYKQRVRVRRFDNDH